MAPTSIFIDINNEFIDINKDGVGRSTQRMLSVKEWWMHA